MSRTLTGSRIALILRRLQGRFGIAAPQVTVRTYVPWYLRIAVFSLAAIFLVTMASWAYDIGSRMAGFDQSESSELQGKLRETNAALEEELVRLRSLLAASESSLQIERAAQQQLSEKNGSLVSENARLKEELAIFERLTSKVDSAFGGDVLLDKLSIKSDSPGRYRFAFMIALQNARRGKDARFSLQLVISLRGENASGKIILPKGNDPDAAQYEIAMRNFRHIDGKFDLPPEALIDSVEFRVLEAGILKASRSVSL